MADQIAFAVNVVAWADKFFGVVVVLRPNWLPLPNEVERRAEDGTASDLLGHFEVYVFGIHEVEIAVPTPKAETLVVFAVVGGEAAELYVEFHGTLDDDEHQEVQLARLVNEIQEFFVLTLEVLFKIAGIEVDRSFVEYDVELDIPIEHGNPSEPIENRYEFVEVRPTASVVGKLGKVLVDDFEINGAGKVVGNESAEVEEVARYLRLFESVKFLRVGKEVDELVVVVNVVEVVDQIVMGRDLEIRIPGVVVRGIDLLPPVGAEKVGGRIEGLTGPELAEGNEKTVLIFALHIAVQAENEAKDEADGENRNHWNEKKDPAARSAEGPLK